MRSEELLATSFFQTHPDDAARIVELTPPAEASALLESIAPDAAAAAVERMAPLASSSCLAAINPKHATAILAELPIDTTVRLLRHMDPPVQETLLGLLPDPMARPARLLLQYPEDTAGALMDPMAHAVPEDIPAEQVHLLIRHDPGNVFYYIYVVDRDHKLAGVVDLRMLMGADPSAPVGSFMISDVTTLPASMDLETLLRHPGWHDYDALPVVDENGTFLGMIRQRLIRQMRQSAEREGRVLDSWQVLLALGELYWIGVGGFFEILMLPAQPHASQDASRATGDTDVRA
jgi:magnesium transporter